MSSAFLHSKHLKLVVRMIPLHSTKVASIRRNFSQILMTQGLNDTTKDYANVLEQIRTCEGDGREGLNRLASIIDLAPGYRMPSVVMRAVLKVFIEASRPRDGMAHLLSAIEHGYRPALEDFELLIFGLLRHSDEEHALEIFKSIPKYGLRIRTATFNLFIDFYLREDQPERARESFRAMEESGLKANQTTYLNFIRFFIARADFVASERIRQYMQNKNIPVDIRFYNGLLECMVRMKETGQVEVLINEMKEAGIQPDAKTFEIIMQCHCLKKGREGLDEVLKAMSKSGISPSIKTFNKLLQSLASFQTPEQTREMLLEMNRQNLTFNRHTYAGLIANLLLSNRPVEAIEMLLHLGNNGVALSIESYGQLLNICLERRLDAGIKVLWQQMRQNGMQPNSHILGVLLQHYLMKRRYNQVENLFLKMNREWKLKPNIFLVGNLLDHYVESLDVPKLREIISLLQEQNLPITGILCNILMKIFYSYCRYQMGGYISRLDLVEIKREKLTESTESTESTEPTKATKSIEWSANLDTSPLNLASLKSRFEELFGIPFRPSVHVYNEMILSLLVRNNFDEMNEIVREMRLKNIAFNLTTFTFLIKARVFSDDLSGARTVLRDMVRNGLRPAILHCALVFHAYCRKLQVKEAEAFLKEIEFSYGLRPNHVFYGSLIYSYSRRMEYSEVFRVFETMEKNGIQPDTETCNYILFSLFDLNEFVEAKKFFEKMIIQGIPRNGHTYAYIIMGHLHRGKDDTNFLNLLSDGIMPGNVIDCFPFNHLMRYYMNNQRQESILPALLMMCDYCVRFDEESSSFIIWALDYHLHDATKGAQLAKIVRKALVDYPEGIFEPFYERIRDLLEAEGCDEELEKLEYVHQNRAELRKVWTQVKDETVEILQERFLSIDSWQELDDVLGLEQKLSSTPSLVDFPEKILNNIIAGEDGDKVSSAVQVQQQQS